MIKHIVLWRLLATDAVARSKAIEEVETAFSGLDALVSEIVTLDIVRNVVHNDSNWDIGLVSEFRDERDFAGYLANADHKKAGAVVSALAAERASIDYEFSASS